MDQLTKGIALAKSVNASARSVEAVVSSEALDRQGDVIDQASWRLDNYRRNPVVLFGHNYDAPIGRADNLQITEGKLEAKIVFASTPRGDEILQLFVEKALRAFSVGFALGRVTAEQNAAGVSFYRLYECELWEISAVAVPANVDALVKCKSLGLVPASYSERDFWNDGFTAEILRKSQGGSSLPADDGSILSSSNRYAKMSDEEREQYDMEAVMQRAGLR